jgi:translation initiation factor IF-3|tara:strand:- start:173 stop:547 length:375 start_codon:yes stop_codon:yes gene_type:complete
MELQGKIKMIGNTQAITDSFKKREIVITTNEQYPQHIMTEFVQDKVDLLNNYEVGQDVKISINIRGREWKNPQGEIKYFNSIQGWRIEKLNNDPSSAEAPPTAPLNSFETISDIDEKEHDDLPF